MLLSLHKRFSFCCFI